MSQNKFHRFGLHYVALLLFFTACDSGKSWQLHDVTGHLPDLQFALIADSGQAVTEQNYRDNLVMMFFGFTRCASECPSTLFRLAKIVQRLGEDANRTRILFISLDPVHDSPQILQGYLRAFGAERAIGLTGSIDEIETLTKRYRAAFRPGKSNDEDIVHSAAVYVFDSKGHARLLVTPDAAIETVANGLLELHRLAVAP